MNEYRNVVYRASFKVAFIVRVTQGLSAGMTVI